MQSYTQGAHGASERINVCAQSSLVWPPSTLRSVPVRGRRATRRRETVAPPGLGEAHHRACAVPRSRRMPRMPHAACAACRVCRMPRMSAGCRHTLRNAGEAGFSACLGRGSSPAALATSWAAVACMSDDDEEPDPCTDAALPSPTASHAHRTPPTLATGRGGPCGVSKLYLLSLSCAPLVNVQVEE